MDDKNNKINWLNIGIVVVIIILMGLTIYFLTCNKQIIKEEKLYKIVGLPNQINVLKSEDYLSSYIVGKYDESYYEIAKENGQVELIDFKDNLVYYQTDKGIYKIDLTDHDFKKEELLKFNQKPLKKLSIIGNDLYFLAQEEKTNSEPIDNVYKSNLSSINQKELIKENISDYVVIDDDVYVLDNTNNFKINDILIEDNTLEILKINDYIFNLIYENDNYFLKYYDPENKTNTLLVSSINMPLGLENIVDYYHDEIYYINGNQIKTIKDNNIIYTGSNLLKIKVINNKLMKVITKDEDVYLKSGEVIKKKELSIIKVIMKNNSIKEFNVENMS